MTEKTPETCGHGEYTLVTRAQTSVFALQITVFGVKCIHCGKRWDLGDMMTAPARAEALERLLKVVHETAAHNADPAHLGAYIVAIIDGVAIQGAALREAQ